MLTRSTQFQIPGPLGRYPIGELSNALRRATAALLADGAMADAGIFATAASAARARAAAETLVHAATAHQ